MFTNKRFQAALLSVTLMLPASSAFAMTHHRVHRHSTYSSTHRHHYSQGRGAIIGGVAGAVIDHNHPVKGALIGAAVGTGVQAVRNHKQ